MRRVAVVALLMSVPSTSTADDGDCKEAYEKGYAVGKDIQELRNDVNELKAALAELLELDRQKMALLESIVGEGEKIPKATIAVQPKPEPRKKPQRKSRRGQVTGKVSFLDGRKIAYVYVENVRGRMVRGRTAEIVQQDRQFRPRFLVVQRGTTVTFPNRDSIYHNVFAKSPAATFDLGIYRKGDQAQSWTFTKPGLIDVYCNMHSKMSTEVLVVPNHLYTKVRPDGSFKLVRVPAGRRKIVAWGPGAEPVSRIVEVSPDGTVRVDLAMKPRAKKAHMNKHGQPYGSYQ